MSGTSIGEGLISGESGLSVGEGLAFDTGISPDPHFHDRGILLEDLFFYLMLEDGISQLLQEAP